MLRRILWSCLFAMSFMVSVRASGATGSLQITVAVNGEATVAEVKVLKHGKSGYVYWTYYQPGGPALPTPLDIELPAGAYDIHVKPAFARGIQSRLEEKTLTLTIEAGRQQRESINFPAAHLKLSAREAGGMTLAGGAIAIGKGWVPDVNAARYMELPAEFEIAPGKYTVLVENTKNKVRTLAQIDVAAGQDLDQSLVFDKAHVGTLQIKLLLDGKPVAPEAIGRYAEVSIFSAKSHEPVQALSGGYGAPSLLASGIYDVSVHGIAVGAEDQMLSGIRIDDGQTVVRSVDIHPSGTLEIVAHWTHQPANLLACAHYHNPLEHLGALMGGSSGSRGQCYDPVVQGISGRISRTDQKDGREERIRNVGVTAVLPGTYNISVWPFDFPELAKTIKQVEITADKLTQKALEFRWPYIEKSVENGNKRMTVLQRRNPIGQGTLQLTASINGVVQTLTAEVDANKLDVNGHENSSIYQYHSSPHAGKPGVALPLTLSLPTGDYYVYIKPDDSHLSPRSKRVTVEIVAGQVVNQTISFQNKK